MSKIGISKNGADTIATANENLIAKTRRISAWQSVGTSANGLLTAQEVIALAGLDKPVTKQPCFAYVNGEYVEVPNRWVTGRHESTHFEPYMTVGNQYEIVQDVDQFTLLDDIRDASDAAYDTVGKLDKGARTFITMKLPDTLQFNGGEDQVDLYLFATNSHDGSSSFTIGVTPLRLTCTNQLTTMVQNAKRVIRLKHTKNINLRAQEVREVLGLTFQYVRAFEEQVEAMIEQHLTDKQFEQFARSFTKLEEKTNLSRGETMATQQFETLLNLWQQDTQLVAGRNHWAAYNAVAEYVDWYSGTRKQKAKNASEARALRTLSNNADSVKQRAWDLLTV